MQAEFYHRLKVQRSIVVMVLAVAAYLQYYLVNVPIADLSQTTKFSPATVKAAEQVVSFKNPETDAGSFELGFDQPAESQKQRMVVDAYFDQASLSDETCAQAGFSWSARTAGCSRDQLPDCRCRQWQLHHGGAGANLGHFGTGTRRGILAKRVGSLRPAPPAGSEDEGAGLDSDTLVARDVRRNFVGFLLQSNAACWQLATDYRRIRSGRGQGSGRIGLPPALGGG